MKDYKTSILMPGQITDSMNAAGLSKSLQNQSSCDLFTELKERSLGKPTVQDPTLLCCFILYTLCGVGAHWIATVSNSASQVTPV